MSEIFERVREAVSAKEAAEYYGLKIDRSGRALCPFHNDRRPSMSFKNGYFRCWACGEHGDSIALAGKLLGLKPIEAVRRLNADFRLNVPLNQPQDRQELQNLRDIREKYEQWRERTINRLNACIRLANRTGHPEAVKWRDALESWADQLANGDMDRQMELFRDRGDIEKRCARILESTQMK